MSSNQDTPQPLSVYKSKALTGSIRVPGDKSISHRALMLGALAFGKTRITGLLEGDDVLATAAAMRAMGAEILRLGEGQWQVEGAGLGGLAEPENVLDMGNAGTGVRLLMGVVAGHPITATFTGDTSLRGRPMQRIIDPIKGAGAQVISRSGGRLPLTVKGSIQPLAQDYRLPMASAQVKSAALFAGLLAPGVTRVIEPQASRDHSENMLRHFGANVAINQEKHARIIELHGQGELRGADVIVASDPSSAAFPMVAALLVPGSQVTLHAVGMNPLRIGLLTTLLEMGANIEITDQRIEGGEPIATLIVKSSELRAVDVPAERVPSMIDEFPILSVAAACAQGVTRMTGLEELRYKESDRLAVMAEGLHACGVCLEKGRDWINITGGKIKGGASVKTRLDHRIAMSFAVLGLVSEEGIQIDDARPIATSFPSFITIMRQLGAAL